jgi:AraC-like DNA-binding protein
MTQDLHDEVEEVGDEGYPPDFDVEGPEDSSGPGRVIVPRSARVRAQAHAQNKKTPNHGAKKGRKPGNTSRRILAQEKRRLGLELRKAGATYDQIAERVGYSDASSARRAVERAIQQVPREAVLELKTLQIERLNHMLMALWPKVQMGDTSAINSSLNVMSKIDALEGTEAAKQVDVNVSGQQAIMVIDGDKQDFIAGMRRMAGLVDPSSGQNAGQAQPQLPAAPSYPPGMGPASTPPSMSPAVEVTDSSPDDQIIDAVVIEDEPEKAHAEKKTFDFSVKPKAQ